MSSQNRAIIDKLLTNVSQKKTAIGHISEMLLPFVGVTQRTGKIAKYGQNGLRIANSVKRGRGKYRQIEAETRSQSTYEIEGHGLEGAVTREDYENVEAPYDAEKDEADAITSILLQEKEYALATALSGSAITQTVQLSGTDQFSDYANSDPLAAFNVAREAVRAGCGRYPDTAWMDKAVRNVLRFHPQLLDALGYKFARPGGLSDDELAVALDVKRILVAEAIYQPGNEGQTDAAILPIWGKHLWFGVIPAMAEKNQIALGYRLGFAGRASRSVSKWAVNNPPGMTAMLVEDEYDQFLMDVSCAYFVEDAIA